MPGQKAPGKWREWSRCRGGWSDPSIWQVCACYTWQSRTTGCFKSIWEVWWDETRWGIRAAFFTCCFPLSLASLLAWMRFLLAHVGSSTHLPLVQGMVSHQFASSPGALQAQTHPSIASVQLLFLRSTLLNWGSQSPPKGSELRTQSAAILQCYEGSHEKKSFPFSLDLKITQDV